MNIEIISSSPRQASITNRIAKHLQQQLQEQTSYNVNIIDVRDWNLGLQQQVFTTIDKTPEEFKPLAERIFNANAYIIVTPEYNGTYSPTLSNLFNHFPKQAKKAFGLVTGSTGIMGGMRATQQLLLLVPALFGVASPQMLVVPNTDKKFDEQGNLLDENFAKNIQMFTNEFLWLANTLQPVEVL